MALLYPWATKEYLLWEMTLGQIIMYFNLGMDLKYPDPNAQESILGKKSHGELKKLKDQMIADGLIDDPQRKQLADKYGEVDA